MGKNKTKNAAAVSLGRMGGKANTVAQNAARAENGRKGGRPTAAWKAAHTCPVCGTPAPAAWDAVADPAWDCQVCLRAGDDDE